MDRMDRMDIIREALEAGGEAGCGLFPPPPKDVAGVNMRGKEEKRFEI